MRRSSCDDSQFEEQLEFVREEGREVAVLEHILAHPFNHRATVPKGGNLLDVLVALGD
ncbi:hypothetical protein D3C84_1294390 [compost metagenome]